MRRSLTGDLVPRPRGAGEPRLTPSARRADPLACIASREGRFELALRCARTGHFAVHASVALFRRRWEAALYAALRSPPAGLEWVVLRRPRAAFPAAVRSRLCPRLPQVSLDALLRENYGFDRPGRGAAEAPLEILVGPAGTSRARSGPPSAPQLLEAEAFRALAPRLRRPFARDPLLVGCLGRAAVAAAGVPLRPGEACFVAPCALTAGWPLGPSPALTRGRRNSR